MENQPDLLKQHAESLKRKHPRHHKLIDENFAWVSEQMDAHPGTRFLPATKRLMLLGLLIVKNNGSRDLLDDVMALIQEVYEASHRMPALDSAATALQQLRFLQQMPAYQNTQENDAL